MSSVKVMLKASKANKAGEAPLVIRIVHGKTNTEVSVKRYLNPKHWNAKKQVVKSSYPSYKALNAFLNKERIEYLSALDFLLSENRPFTAKEVAAKRKGESTGTDSSLVEWLRSYIDKNPDRLSSTTISYYQSLWKKLQSYAHQLRFKDVNTKWLQHFERSLEDDGLARNTIHNRLKVLRKAVKEGIRQEIITKDPFVHFKLKTEATKREYLNQEEIQALQDLDVSQASYSLVRDIFIFSCYTGLRFGDICQLKPSSIYLETTPQGEEVMKLRFRMSKTGDLIALKLPKPAADIVAKLQNDSESESWLFPILSRDTYSSDAELKRAISARNAYFNKVLKLLATQAEITKNVSMHVARHTFATLALTLGVRIEVLSKLLGHKDIKTTQIYGHIVSKSMDEAMDRFNL